MISVSISKKWKAQTTVAHPKSQVPSTGSFLLSAAKAFGCFSSYVERPVKCCRWKLLTGNRAENGYCRTTAWFLFLNFLFSGGVNQHLNNHSPVVQRDKLTAVLPAHTALTSHEFGKTPFWLTSVSSYVSVPQGILFLGQGCRLASTFVSNNSG